MEPDGKTIEVAYRVTGEGIPPRPIKLQIPGWAGDSHGHANGDKAQPWHCVPFVEGNTYGLEMVYPYEEECRVSNIDGKIEMTGDVRFQMFAAGHFGYCSCMDIQVPPGHVVRLEPHPRYFTDHTGTVPLMVPGHLQTEWWTRIFFIVFKVPFPGQTHIFRKGEPYGQMLIVPKKVNYKLREMTPAEKEKRIRWEQLSMLYDSLIGERSWVSNTGNHFNDEYKVMARAWAKGGEQGIEELFKKAKEKSVARDAAQRKSIQDQMPRKVLGLKRSKHERLAE